jgi:hypothetical protein
MYDKRTDSFKLWSYIVSKSQVTNGNLINATNLSIFFFFWFVGGCRLAMSEQMKKCMYRTLTKLLYTYN